MSNENKTAPATPATSVDTAEFQNLLGDWLRASRSNRSYGSVKTLRDAFIAHIDAHTARAVAAEGQSMYAAGIKLGKSIAATPQQHAQAALSIGAHLPFELAAKALHYDWTSERVHHLIDVVDQFIAASHQPAAAPAQPEVKP